MLLDAPTTETPGFRAAASGTCGRESKPGAAAKVPLVARFLPSLTDLAFLMPVILVFVKLGGARTLLADGDTGWHVRTGEWILANHRVPHTDLFSFSRPGAPWFAWEWLWDVLFAMLHQRWGMAAVVLASLAVICLSGALLFRLIRRKCENGLVAIAVTLLATGGCAIHWLARPHLFTFLFLIVALHITDRAAGSEMEPGRPRTLAWLIPLTLLWANVHGGFFVIFLVLACYIGSDLLNAGIDGDPARRRAFLGRLKPWAAAFAACLAATFINPYGWQLHKHIADYISDPYQLQHIAEFEALDFHSPAVVYFEPLMILAILTALWDARHRRFAEVFLSLGWLHMALVAERNLPLFTIAASPFVARAIVALIRSAASCASSPALAPPSLAPWIGSAARWFEQATASYEATDRIGRVHLAGLAPLALVGAILLATPAAAGVLDNKFASTYDPRFFPERALPVLSSPEARRIFAIDQWGDYLIYRLHSSKKVFIDGRSDFYGDEFNLRYLDLMNVQHGWEKTLDKYRIDTIVLAPRFALTQALKISPDWRVVHDDGVAVVFRRNPGGPNSLVTSDEGKDRDRAITKTITRDPPITQPTT
jgi:hypothetical protein